MPPDLPALAREVRRQCALLADALDALRGMPPDGFEEALAEHLGATRPLEQALAAAVSELNARRAEVDRLPAAARREVEAAVDEARGSLRASAAAYAGVSARMADVLGSVRCRLDAVRQGGRILRGYRRAAR